MKYEDDLHNCTPERLAEMLEETAEEALKYAKTIQLSWEAHEAVEFEYGLLMESARRLHELQNPTFPKRN